MTSPVYRRAVELMEADIGSELVALDPDQGNCFGFNEAATSVWRSLHEPRNFDQLRDALLADYEVDADQCSRDLKELLEDLIRKGLVERAPERRNNFT